MAAGTLSLVGIVEAWEPWWLLWQLPARSCSSSPGSRSCARPPFDMPVADSEIIFGAFTEYTGLRFALFLLAEYAGILLLCALTTVLFLGGWKGPFDDALGWLWTLLKTLALSFLVIWARVSYPRLREDQLQRFAWQALVPVACCQLGRHQGVVRVAALTLARLLPLSRRSRPPSASRRPSTRRGPHCPPLRGEPLQHRAERRPLLRREGAQHGVLGALQALSQRAGRRRPASVATRRLLRRSAGSRRRSTRPAVSRSSTR